MFSNWLDLFEATAAELFVPEIADQFALNPSSRIRRPNRLFSASWVPLNT
jgi:hypothetical protein